MSDAVDLLLELGAIATSSRRGARSRGRRAALPERPPGLEPDEDDFGPRIGSNAGNVYARLEPTAEGTPLFFCAHLDTVPPSGELRPVVEDGLIRNAGGTILGADNKAAVAQMLEGVRRVLGESIPHAGIELVLTRQEEVGLVGAYAFEPHPPACAGSGFVYDQEGSIGEIILGAPWSPGAWR